MKIHREDLLYRYSQYSVDRNINSINVLQALKSEIECCDNFIFSSTENEIRFFFKKELWESQYFMLPSIKLIFIDYTKFIRKDFQEALFQFVNHIRDSFGNNSIITIEIPAEDIRVLQALNDSRFRTIETRLHFVNNSLDKFSWERFQVREASTDDIPNLKRVASYMRNDFDRFHSDWSFNIDKADNYLSTYVENSIKGFTDLVIVPNQQNVPPDSFLTANYLKSDWDKLDYKISKMVLSAVSSDTNKGWYIKLISEMTFILKEIGAKSVFMNTQATNIAVLVTWEKLGYRLGRTTHILTLNLND